LYALTALSSSISYFLGINGSIANPRNDAMNAISISVEYYERSSLFTPTN